MNRRKFIRSAATAGLFIPAAPAILCAMPGPFPITLMSGAPLSPTQLWVNAVVAAGGSVSGGRQTLVAAMITDLQADGLWTKLDRLWLLAAENTQSATIDMKALDQVTVNNSPTFTTDRGYAGNGSSAYLLTGFKPSLGPNFSQDSAMYAVYQNVANTNAGMALGNASGGNPHDFMHTRNLSNNLEGAINDYSTGYSISVASATGMFMVTRTGASAVAAYKDGSSIGTTTVASVGVDTGFMELLGSQAWGDYTDGRLAMAAFGSGFDSTEASNFNTHLVTYLTAIGAN